MTRIEHLLIILSEECAETSQRATKALRFGLEEIQPNQPSTNAERITEEFAHTLAVFCMLVKETSIKEPSNSQILAKFEKVEQYLKYSKKCGTL